MNIEGITDRLRTPLKLLVGQRVLPFIVLDVLILIFGFLFTVVLKESVDIYQLALLPCLVLGLPVLADVIALERRSGTLEIALSSPGAGGLFERRAFGFAGILGLQCLFVLVAARVLVATFALVPAFIQLATACALLAASALFWGAHLKSSGASLLGSLCTIALLSPWLFSSAYFPLPKGRLFPEPDELLSWLRANLVLGSAALLLALYARRRLRRPEALLS